MTHVVSLIDCQGIAEFDFPNLSGCIQLIKVPKNKFGNYLALLLTDDPSVVYSMVDPPFGNYDYSFISFSV